MATNVYSTTLQELLRFFWGANHSRDSQLQTKILAKLESQTLEIRGMIRQVEAVSVKGGSDRGMQGEGAQGGGGAGSSGGKGVSAYARRKAREHHAALLHVLDLISAAKAHTAAL